MKKLVFLFTMIFAVSMAMGQSNSAEITQEGDSNYGNIEQIGASNTGQILQDATVGNGNYAIIQQFTSLNEGFIDQIGDNDAEILQQGGEGNFADIKQTGTFDRTYNTYGQTIRNYYGIVNQNGWENDAIIVQTGGSGRVFISQTGTENYAVHDQGVNSYGKTYNNGLIEQVGNNNEAYQWRQGTGGGNKMNIRQLNGNFNVATQDLNDIYGSDSFSSNNDLNILQQDGSSNEAFQQVFSLTNWGVGGNDLSIEQTGSNNFASQIANTKNNFSTIIQTGNMNEAVTLQQ